MSVPREEKRAQSTLDSWLQASCGRLSRLKTGGRRTMITRRWPPALCAVISFIGFACLAERPAGLAAAAPTQQKKAAAPAKGGATAKTGATAPHTGIPQKNPIAPTDESLKA